MSDTQAGLLRMIGGAKDLQSVVRSMKALAASGIVQYERSVSALAEYSRTIDFGLRACLRQGLSMSAANAGKRAEPGSIGAVVFGSDHGLVGQFNEVLVNVVLKTLTGGSAALHVWTVGERIHARLADEPLSLRGGFILPNSIAGISPLIGQILAETESFRHENEGCPLLLFYNSPRRGAVYAPVSRQLFPLDDAWLQGLRDISWPTSQLPQVFGDGTATLRTLIGEYLFVSLFRACAESLASENASRLAAMQRADKNIEELLEELNGRFHRLRQSTIDEELFDILSGFKALSKRSA